MSNVMLGKLYVGQTTSLFVQTETPLRVKVNNYAGTLGINGDCPGQRRPYDHSVYYLYSFQ